MRFPCWINGCDARTAQEQAYIIWESFNPPTNSSSGRLRADRVAEAILTEAPQAPQEAEFASMDLDDVRTGPEIQRQVSWLGFSG